MVVNRPPLERRARVTSDGRPLPTDELRVERDRLTTALNQLAIDIAAAKAEIQSQRRAEEIEIWETQLVALQASAELPRPAPPPPTTLPGQCVWF